MPIFLSSFLLRLGVKDGFEQTLLFGLVVAWAVVMAVRVALAISYKTQLRLVRSAVKKDAKAEKGASEEGLSGSLFFKRAVKDYTDLGERGIARIDARELCEKSAAWFRFLFWRKSSVEAFVDVIEPAFLWIGILFTVISASPGPFAAAAVVIFLAGRILAMFFDHKTVREELLSESAFLLDREYGKLFLTDVPAAVNNLRVELKNVMTYQSTLLSDSINDLKEKLSAVSEKTLGETAAAVEKTLVSVAASAETVAKPLAQWREVIDDSRKANEELGVSIIKMSGGLDGFKERLEEMERLISGYKAEFLINNQNVEKELSRLNDISASMTEQNGRAVTQVDAVGAALEFVRSNQAALENSLNQYEQALKDITSEVGGGLGKIIDYHSQSAYQSMADVVAENLKQASAQNNELLNKLTGIFDRILEQSRNETSLIMNLKEQMEIELTILKNSVSASGRANNGQAASQTESSQENSQDDANR